MSAKPARVAASTAEQMLKLLDFGKAVMLQLDPEEVGRVIKATLSAATSIKVGEGEDATVMEVPDHRARIAAAETARKYYELNLKYLAIPAEKLPPAADKAGESPEDRQSRVFDSPVGSAKLTVLLMRHLNKTPEGRAAFALEMSNLEIDPVAPDE
jgi:hypothetical protein